ncbi:toll/interleukin-1 receptor domain-containing protein [Thermodesulfobacteriota bacterium]
MCEQRDIFLSYSHDDAEIATELASRLGDAGLTCFVAERDITATQQWEPRIRDELRSAQCVLILLTPRSRDSAWVAIETGAAWVLERDIVPATMFVDVNELTEPIRRYQARRVETNAQVITLIQELQQKLRPEQSVLEEPIDKVTEKVLVQKESFNERSVWERLQKIGSWTFDDASHVFQGEGKHQYLLSHYEYGRCPFKITTRIRFTSLAPVNEVAAVNAGLVFGWRSTGNILRYLHVMFSGTDLLLEVIGNKSGPVHKDYEHVGNGVPFQLVPGRYYDIEAIVRDSNLTVHIDGVKTYSVRFAVDVKGRVGIRPWRSRIESDMFLVEEL